jgi:hypothetical protein
MGWWNRSQPSNAWRIGMTKEQRAARDRLIAYAQRPDVYYPPTPEECRTAYEMIEALHGALADIDSVGVDFGHYESAARTMQEHAQKALGTGK